MGRAIFGSFELEILGLQGVARVFGTITFGGLEILKL